MDIKRLLEVVREQQTGILAVKKPDGQKTDVRVWRFMCSGFGGPCSIVLEVQIVDGKVMFVCPRCGRKQDIPDHLIPYFEWIVQKRS